MGAVGGYLSSIISIPRDLAMNEARHIVIQPGLSPRAGMPREESIKITTPVPGAGSCRWAMSCPSMSLQPQHIWIGCSLPAPSPRQEPDSWAALYCSCAGCRIRPTRDGSTTAQKGSKRSASSEASGGLATVPECWTPENRKG